MNSLKRKSKQRTTTLPNPLVACADHSQETIRETFDTNIFGFAAWCRDYHNRTAYPCTTLQRLVIAIYQLHQGIGWNDNAVGYKEYESFASSACHFMMVGAALELDVTDDMPIGVVDFNELETWPLDYKKLLKTIAEVSQQTFYGEKTFRDGYARKSRYNPLRTQQLLANLVTMLFASIPRSERSVALEQATSIMTKRL